MVFVNFKFRKKLQEANKKELTALLGTINLDEKERNYLFKRIKESGFIVKEDKELKGKRIIVQSIIPEKSFKEYLNPELVEFFHKERKEREEAVFDLIDSLEITDRTVPIISSCLEDYHIVYRAMDKFWQRLSDVKPVNQVTNEEINENKEKISDMKAENSKIPLDLKKYLQNLELYYIGENHTNKEPIYYFYSFEHKVIISVIYFGFESFAVFGRKGYYVKNKENFTSRVDFIPSFTDY